MAATTAVEVIAKDKKRRRSTNEYRREKKVLVLRELPLFPLTPGDLKHPQTPAASSAGDPNNVHVDNASLILRLGFPNDQENMMIVGYEEEEAEAVEEEEKEVVWRIRKVLKKSDINDCSRLLVGNDMARNHVFPNLSPEEAERVESGRSKADGAADVVVWDVDTGSEHRLQFRRWKSSGCYLFNNDWMEGFVRRRRLKEGDEVGLYFDDQRRRFVFSVLNRSSSTP